MTPSSVIYHCPNCGSGLTFAPETQMFHCAYCRSNFSEADLSSRQATEPSPWSPAARAPAEMEPLPIQSYRCPSCGGEIIGDETTAATSCVYCHNPVVLAGQLSGAWKPDSVIPFAFDKNDVTERFRIWAKKHLFIDKRFLNTAAMENLHGLYAPFWVIEGNAKGEMQATGIKVRTWRRGDTEYTETSRFDVSRTGAFTFGNLALKAIDKQSALLIDGIFPYDISQVKPFSMPYLSGFLAEKRTLEKADLSDEASDLVMRAARARMHDSITGYSSVNENGFSFAIRQDTWRYALMPVWLMTCRFRGKDYFFAMNGQTGKLAGKVPVSRRKLAYLFCSVGIIVSALTMLVLGIDG